MPYLIIPGWAGSGPDHWQSHWESELDGAHRVEMPDWYAPRREAWLAALDQAIRTAPAPPTLIAHSLGCIAVAHWAARASRPIDPTGEDPRPAGRAGPAPRSALPIRGALLVAPADLDHPSCPAELRDFAPVPREKLPFPAHVVASDDDPYASLVRARQIASDWGARVTVMGGAGHISCDAGFGPWREGRALLGAIG